MVKVEPVSYTHLSYITKDGRLILSSEVGVLDIPAEEIVRKDRLRPGTMLLVDTARGELVDDESLKADYASREPRCV